MSVLLNQYEKGYILLWETMVVRPEKKAAVALKIEKAKANRVRYMGISEAVKKLFPESLLIPWQFIAVVHYMECNFSFLHHLHNGDSLLRRTVNVPKGRPVAGKPPFKFEMSAIDALIYQGLHDEKNWSIPNMLLKLEAYNGYGYRGKGINTPYLWAGSNHYTKGKYIADHVYSKTAVSDQIGSALILRGII